jgi:PAS domain S-box-containing protein
MIPLADEPDQLRKLLLLSADPAEESLLSQHLETMGRAGYDLKLVPSLKALKRIELKTACDAILLDIRAGYTQALEAIEWIGKQQNSVALICLCANHEQLNCYRQVMHLIDDYVLAETLPDGELRMRISHAIRRRVEENALLHEQDLLRSLMENIPDSIYFKDRESRFTKANPALARSYGYDVDTMVGKSDFDLFTEEHALPAYQDEQRIIQTGKSIVGKIEKETFADGSTRWVNTTKVPLRDTHGRIIGTMGISRDVSELKRAQDKLTEEHRLLSTILNNVPDRIFVKDRTGRYIASNRLHLKFLGMREEKEVLGTTLYDHFEEEHADKYFKEDMKIIRTGIGMINTEERRQQPDGTVVWYLTSKVPLVDETGKCVGLVGISRDVTEQKENEKKLRNTIKVLKETQLQLIEAEKLKTVGRLAAGVAHEVKNPLNVVSLGAEYLHSKVTHPKELVEIIRDMKQAIQRANSVISQLLDYSSPHEVTTAPQDLNEIIREVLGMMRHNFNEAHVELQIDLAETLPPVAVDTQKMDQVFINLFLNAISAMRGGGVLGVRSYTQKMKSTGSNVSSELTETFKVGETIVTIEITDTGHGIDKKMANKLFDPFFSTKTTGEGTGLGLSVTQSIIEMHRGIITLENRKDARGARATLYFPISPAPNA